MTTNELVLPSLQIQGFRTFKNTTIKKLERVNLIVGKNNVGKTSFLEALWLYARMGSPSVIGDQLALREESAPTSFIYNTSPSSSAMSNIFFGRKEKTNGDHQIQIGPLEFTQRVLAIAIEEHPDTSSQNRGMIPFFIIRLGGKTKLFTELSPTIPEIPFIPNLDQISHVFVSANSLTNAHITALWDKTALTSQEDEVISALQIIAPDVERINMISDPAIGPQRIAMMRLKGQSKPIPLRSYGDGMNRLFVIALAAANASNGLLLIDEIENGLHYSVQLDVWRLIFDLAHRLNIQVFATTHSWDCVEAFQRAAAEHPEQGQIIRLGRKQDTIVATRFDEQELAIITRDQIEVR